MQYKTSKFKNIKKIFVLFMFLSSVNIFAQNNIIDEYIKTGLENNIVLQQKNASYEKSLYALKEAKALFLPSISINARYTAARGGRIIEFPLGDMLNGVYTSLNVLTALHGMVDPYTGKAVNFPQLENMEFQFYRDHEHETKISLVQPIFNPQILYNKKIKNSLTNVKKADLETYKRTLVAEIKTAYFNYMKTLKLNELLDNTKKLLQENIRVNEKLYENDKITIDVVYRSKSELSKLGQQMAETTRAYKSSKAYFNFLLNKDLDSEIIASSEIDLISNIYNINYSEQNAINNREELRGLESFSKIAENNIKLNKGNKLPVLTAAVDYGFQGEEYRFGNEDDFMLASLVLKWDLFRGYGNRAKISQSIIEKKMVDQKQEEVKNQIKLQVINSFYDLEAAGKSIIASEDQKISAEKAFKLINRKYLEGQANLLEYIDAQTTYTNASSNLIINKYNYLIKYAEYEKVSALYNIPIQ